MVQNKTNAAGKEIAKAVGTTVAAVLVARIAEVSAKAAVNAISSFFRKRKESKAKSTLNVAA